MEEVLLFGLTFICVFLLYYFFIIKRTLKKKKKGMKKEVVEVLYLVSVYKLDINKVNYNKLLYVVSVVSSFDIALTISIMSIFKSFWWQLITGFVLVFITILISYHIVYLFYKRGGMIKDES